MKFLHCQHEKHEKMRLWNNYWLELKSRTVPFTFLWGWCHKMLSNTIQDIPRKCVKSIGTRNCVKTVGLTTPSSKVMKLLLKTFHTLSYSSGGSNNLLWKNHSPSSLYLQLRTPFNLSGREILIYFLIFGKRTKDTNEFLNNFFPLHVTASSKDMCNLSQPFVDNHSMTMFDFLDINLILTCNYPVKTSVQAKVK